MSAGYLYDNVDLRVSVVCQNRIPARSLDVIALGGVLAERGLFLATQCLRAADAAGAALYDECLVRLGGRDGAVWSVDQFPPALKRAADAAA